jgi:hypothetical protein
MSANHFDHYCEHPGCVAWGEFGFGVDLLRGRRGHWFCADHRGEGLPKQAVPPLAPQVTAGLPLFGGGLL